MVRKQSKRAGAWLLAAGMFLLYFAALLAAFHVIGTSDGLYHKLQMRADILPEAGISEEELVAVDASLARYLAGDAAALDDSPFNERELTHMADCFDLFVLLRRVLAGSILLAAVLLLCGAAACGCWNFGRAALTGALAFVAVIAALGIWGAVDFDSLFTAFHHLLFANDLWLLDPRTDLLIRICPQSMFSAMAVMIAGMELIVIALVNLLSRLATTVLWRNK